MYHRRKINVTFKGVYLPISKLHLILAVPNLLAHNNIGQICYCGQILLQSAAVNCSFLTIWHLWQYSNIYFAGDSTSDNYFEVGGSYLGCEVDPGVFHGQEVICSVFGSVARFGGTDHIVVLRNELGGHLKHRTKVATHTVIKRFLKLLLNGQYNFIS